LSAEELLTAAIAKSSEQVLRSLHAALLGRGGARSRLATDASIQGQGRPRRHRNQLDVMNSS